MMELMCLQVCDEFVMHRETFYLSINFFDRYLDTKANVPKNKLQIVGIACLYIAAKLQV